MKKALSLLFWLLLVDLLAVFMLIPANWTEEVIARERALVEKSLGVQTRAWIDAKASAWFRASVVASGVREGAYRLLVPSPEERRGSRGMEELGRSWFTWVEGRIAATLKTLYQFYRRLALFLVWAPYMPILLVPAIHDGSMTRRIKRTNFDYASPVLHRYSLLGVACLTFGLFVVFFLPVALDPLVIPLVMMSCCVLLGLGVANLQKRM